jgi:hypothetical protein
MRWTTRLAVVAVTAVTAVTASPVAATSIIDTMTNPGLVVRVYDATALPPEDGEAALGTAGAILEAAGLEVRWRACGDTFVRPAADPCLAPLAANELAVRLVRLPPARTAPVPLGYSLVDTELRGGSLATVYVDRVANLASLCEIDVHTILGRAVAHEIGHLLLGTRDHAHVGVMRAVWSRETLRRDRAGDWMFTSRDGRALRNAVRVRNARQLAQHIAWSN